MIGSKPVVTEPPTYHCPNCNKKLSLHHAVCEFCGNHGPFLCPQCGKERRADEFGASESMHLREWIGVKFTTCRECHEGYLTKLDGLARRRAMWSLRKRLFEAAGFTFDEPEPTEASLPREPCAWCNQNVLPDELTRVSIIAGGQEQFFKVCRKCAKSRGNAGKIVNLRE